MANNEQNPQAALFYGNEWTEAMDNSFIDQLVEEIKAGAFTIGHDNSTPLKKIMEALNTEYQANLTMEQLLLKLKFLQKRFRVFDWLVHTTGVHYDRDNNVVVAEAWELLHQAQPLTRAYTQMGDPKWEELCTIFDKDGYIRPIPEDGFEASDEDGEPTEEETDEHVDSDVNMEVLDLIQLSDDNGPDVDVIPISDDIYSDLEMGDDDQHALYISSGEITPQSALSNPVNIIDSDSDEDFFMSDIGFLTVPGVPTRAKTSNSTMNIDPPEVIKKEKDDGGMSGSASTPSSG